MSLSCFTVSSGKWSHWTDSRNFWHHQISRISLCATLSKLVSWISEVHEDFQENLFFSTSPWLLHIKIVWVNFLSPDGVMIAKTIHQPVLQSLAMWISNKTVPNIAMRYFNGETRWSSYGVCWLNKYVFFVSLVGVHHAWQRSLTGRS